MQFCSMIQNEKFTVKLHDNVIIKLDNRFGLQWVVCFVNFVEDTSHFS